MVRCPFSEYDLFDTRYLIRSFVPSSPTRLVLYYTKHTLRTPTYLVDVQSYKVNLYIYLVSPVLRPDSYT